MFNLWWLPVEGWSILVNIIPFKICLCRGRLIVYIRLSYFCTHVTHILFFPLIRSPLYRNHLSVSFNSQEIHTCQPALLWVKYACEHRFPRKSIPSMLLSVKMLWQDLMGASRLQQLWSLAQLFSQVHTIISCGLPAVMETGAISLHLQKIQFKKTSFP